MKTATHALCDKKMTKTTKTVLGTGLACVCCQDVLGGELKESRYPDTALTRMKMGSKHQVGVGVFA